MKSLCHDAMSVTMLLSSIVDKQTGNSRLVHPEAPASTWDSKIQKLEDPVEILMEIVHNGESETVVAGKGALLRAIKRVSSNRLPDRQSNEERN